MIEKIRNIAKENELSFFVGTVQELYEFLGNRANSEEFYKHDGKTLPLIFFELPSTLEISNHNDFINSANLYVLVSTTNELMFLKIKKTNNYLNVILKIKQILLSLNFESYVDILNKKDGRILNVFGAKFKIKYLC